MFLEEFIITTFDSWIVRFKPEKSQIPKSQSILQFVIISACDALAGQWRNIGQ